MVESVKILLIMLHETSGEGSIFGGAIKDFSNGCALT
jgi:hypothetical protein